MVKKLTHEELEKRITALEHESSERTTGEKELRENEEKYRQLFHTVPDAILLFEAETRKFIDVNDAALHMYGYSREEFLNLTNSDITAELEESEKTIKQTIHRKIQRIPLRYHTKKDGTKFPVEISAGAMKLDDKNILCGVIRDITQRKTLEDALKESKEKYRLLIDSSDAAISLFDQNGTYLLLNVVAANWLKGKPQNFVGKTVHDTFSKEFADNLLEILKKIIQSGVGETIGGMVDPLNRYVSSSLRPVRKSDGEIIGVQVVSRDISEQRRKENEKQQLLSQLERAQKMESIGNLAGGIAHDFNNILSSVIGYTQLGMEDLTDKIMLRKNLKGVLNAAFRAQNLIRQIITFSRPIKTGFGPILLSPVIKETLKFLKATLPSTIIVKRYLKVDRDIAIADASQIHQVLMNLCVNASQAMGENGGNLKVTLTNVDYDSTFVDLHNVTHGSYLKLSVSDSGPGIPPEHIEKIFDPFFTTKDEYHGSGLGLSVVRRIVDEHGGTIQIDSKIGEGSTFNVFFPTSEKKMMEDEKISETAPTGKGRILLVDDEATILKWQSRMLTQLGYDVETCQESTKALDLFQRQPDRFDMVVTDMTMPHIRGDRLAKELMKTRPDIPIILCTGHSGFISEKKALSMGLRGFLPKPFTKQNIAKMIRSVLDEI